MWWCLFQSDPPGIGFDDNDKCDAELQVLMKYKSRFWQDWIWIIHFTGVTPCLSQLLLIYLCTLKHEHPAGKKREPQQRHWTEERSKNRSPRWNEPLWRRLTDRLFELQRAVYLAAAKKRKKKKKKQNINGFGVPHFPCIPPYPETEALTCVSMMRRFDLRDSDPPTLLWQGSDNGLRTRKT